MQTSGIGLYTIGAGGSGDGLGGNKLDGKSGKVLKVLGGQHAVSGKEDHCPRHIVRILCVPSRREAAE